MRVGLIARSDRTGLGNQTRNLARLLNPDKILLIDSTPFNGNKQYPETYKKYDFKTIHGMINDQDAIEFIKSVDVVITCEIFYNMHFELFAKELGVKTINQYNWEFAEYLRDPNLTLPDKLVSPSHWNIERATNLWGDRVEYLPTPVFTGDLEWARKKNLERTGKKRFLHIMGRQAVHDRNGTIDLVKALQFCREDFELVIKAQAGDLSFLRALISPGLVPNVIIDVESPDNEAELYYDFDAMVLPRKYGGQCLPMTEALCAGLPVIMTDISPNNQVLPPFWCVPATQTGRFMTRTWVDVYSANLVELAQKLDMFSGKDLQGLKVDAYNTGYRQYSDVVLKEKWEKLIEDTLLR